MKAIKEFDRPLKPGDILTATANLRGVARIDKGDTARYLGNGQIRVLTGRSTGWTFEITLGGSPLPFIKRGD